MTPTLTDLGAAGGALLAAFIATMRDNRRRIERRLSDLERKVDLLIIGITGRHGHTKGSDHAHRP